MIRRMLSNRAAFAFFLGTWLAASVGAVLASTLAESIHEGAQRGDYDEKWLGESGRLLVAFAMPQVSFIMGWVLWRTLQVWRAKRDSLLRPG